MSHFELKAFATNVELAHAAAEEWLNAVEQSNRLLQAQCVALSGGRIARDFFAAVAERALARAVSLATVHFFWADERCVPPDNDESNFLLANQNLFQPLGIGMDRLHRLQGELPAGIAVNHAIADIENVVPRSGSGMPRLDLVVLGMGEDGHVASLFPNAPEDVAGSRAPYLAVVGPKPPPQRLTLSYAAIAAAGEVWVLASGAGKETALKNSLVPDGRTPLARVIQSRTRTSILTDVRL